MDLASGKNLKNSESMYGTVQTELSASDLDAARLGFAQLLRRKRFSARFIEANAEDLLARARFEYSRALAGGAEIHSPPGWIIHCAWRRTQNLLEAESKQPNFVSTEMAGAIEDTAAPTPEAAAICEERARRIEVAVAQLSADQRTLIELSYFEGMSVREAGRFLNWHASKAQRCHEAALRRLRELLGVEDAGALAIEIGLAAWVAVSGEGSVGVHLPGIDALLAAGERARGGVWRRAHDLARRFVLGGGGESGGAMAAGGAARTAGACGAAAVACLASGVIGPGVGGVGLLSANAKHHRPPAKERGLDSAGPVGGGDSSAVASPVVTDASGKFSGAGQAHKAATPANGTASARSPTPSGRAEAEFSPFGGEETSAGSAANPVPVARSASTAPVGGGESSAAGRAAANQEFGAFK
jgi:RNA polymerase sigma factor (sigma-70 family)